MIIKNLLLIINISIFASASNNDLPDSLFKSKEQVCSTYEIGLSQSWFLEVSFDEHGSLLRFTNDRGDKFEFDDVVIANDVRLIRLNGRALGTVKAVKDLEQGETKLVFDKCSLETRPLDPRSKDPQLEMKVMERLSSIVNEMLLHESTLDSNDQPGNDSVQTLILHKNYSPLNEGRGSGGYDSDTRGGSRARLGYCVSCALGILGYAGEILAMATAPETLGAGAAIALATHAGTVAAIAINCPKAVSGKQ